MSKSRSSKLLEKSIAAMLSAIEIYNKPDFRYREETFAVLAVNGWELLLKAKILEENNNRLNSIYVYEKRTTKLGKTSKKKYIKCNRSCNPVTISLRNAITKIENTIGYPLNPKLKSNLYGLLEITNYKLSGKAFICVWL